MKPARFFKKNGFASGQGLIELLAALAVGTILILALVSLSLKANTSANSSRVATQASKLAEEGLEIVNNILNTNDLSAVANDSTSCNAGTMGATPCSLSSIIGHITFPANARELLCSPPTSLGSHTCTYPAPANPGTCTTQASWCLIDANGGWETVNMDAFTFQRVVFLSNYGESDYNCAFTTGLPASADPLQVRVVVQWTDPSGTKQREADDCLAVLRQ